MCLCWCSCRYYYHNHHDHRTSANGGFRSSRLRTLSRAWQRRSRRPDRLHLIHIVPCTVPVQPDAQCYGSITELQESLGQLKRSHNIFLTLYKQSWLPHGVQGAGIPRDCSQQSSAQVAAAARTKVLPVDFPDELSTIS